MLVRLVIRDYLLAAHLEFTPSAGLNVLTGETGAGKSIILRALGLVLGSRADSQLIRPGCEQAIITGSFAVALDHPAMLLLADHGYPQETLLTVRRIIRRDGRNQAFVNDDAASSSFLKQLGSLVGEIHGQHAIHDFLSAEAARIALDAWHNTPGLHADMATAYHTWQHSEQTLATASQQQEAGSREQAFLAHAIEELAALAPKPDEESLLATQRANHMRHSKMIDACREALAALGSGGASRLILTASRKLESLPEDACDQLRNPLQALDQAAISLADAEAALEQFLADSLADNQTIDSLEERLFALRAAARKYQVTPDDLPQMFATLQHQYAQINTAHEQTAALKQQATAAKTQYYTLAQQVSAKRQQAAAVLADAVNSQLPALKLPQARFNCHVSSDATLASHGMDNVVFTLQANQGLPAAPLHKAASGGELARVVLALKAALADKSSLPLMVFDEVDSGVGGSTATAVGTLLATLAQGTQVLVITHSAQVAAFAACHWLVRKDTNEPVAYTTLCTLDEDARVQELARMLAGRTITREAQAAARQLLDDDAPDAHAA